MAKSINIDTVAAEFKKWRSKKQPNERIPEALWDLVREIYHHYPRSLLCKRLSIAGSQLNQHGLMSKATPRQKQKKTDKVSFVSIKPTSVDIGNNSIYIEAIRQDGLVLKLQCAHPNQAASLFEQLIG